jgi:hypothetical protein
MAQTNLGLALWRLSQREIGSLRLEEALLEEALTAFRNALMEWTRERVPLYWAKSFGSQGVALMRLALLTKNAPMAETAVVQIEAAFKTLRDGGNAHFAAGFESYLPEARRIRNALKGP